MNAAEQLILLGGVSSASGSDPSALGLTADDGTTVLNADDDTTPLTGD